MLWHIARQCVACCLAGLPMTISFADDAISASAPSWLSEALAAEPTVQSRLFRIESVEAVNAANGEIGQATLGFTYLDVHGEPREASARLWVQREQLAQGVLTPLLFYAHYELPPDLAIPLCEKGWSVLTPHAVTELFAVNSDNLNLALLEWGRRLPFVDRTHLVIEGGSAGGYMTLAMASEIFPVAAAVPMVPLVNMSYNLAYFVENCDVALGGVARSAEIEEIASKAPIPVLAALARGASLITSVYGEDLGSPSYLYLSPVHYTVRITCPVVLCASTADMLVPMQQISSVHAIAPDPNAFPEGFRMELAPLAKAPGSAVPFLDVLPKEQRAVFVKRIPDGTPVLGPMAALVGDDKKPPGKPIDVPFDNEKQWSVVILDEGPPSPKGGHYKFYYSYNADSFKAHCRSAPLSLGQLTAPKLRRLAERFTGKLPELPVLKPQGDALAAVPVNRLNAPLLEQLDVLTGLLDYADQGPDFEARLAELYLGLPEDMRPWGSSINKSELRDAVRQLRAAAGEVGSTNMLAKPANLPEHAPGVWAFPAWRLGTADRQGKAAR